MTRCVNSVAVRHWVVAILLLATPFVAQAGQVEGRIVDADGEGVALPAILEVHDGQQIVYQSEELADDTGLARWAEVPDSDGLSARMRATYDGAEYISAVVALDSGAGVLELTVLPVAREGRPLHLDTLHLIVQADEPGFVRVLQFMTISNAGEAAFAGGPQLAEGRSAGIVIPLPATARNVSPAPFPNAEQALNPAFAQFDSDRVLDARPVPTGGRQLAVTYELPLDSGLVDVSLLMPYPAANVSLLLGGVGAPELSLDSAQLQAQQTEMIGDQQYRLWVAAALQPGTDLSFTIGPAGLALTAGQIGLMAAAAGLLLAVVGSLVTGGSTEYRAGQERKVLAALAALDDAHAAGDVGDGDYFYRRGRELDRLALLDASTGAAKSDGD